ncbi:helix-turn-helix domain-containing protein [Gulosibacter macacae]|nr:helix-turn-helix domain-containing protein [Gulosibacter macacae]
MTLVLDTRTVVPTERARYWAAGISQRLFPMQVEAGEKSAFEARLTGGEQGPVLVCALSSGPHRVGRSARMIRSADPEFLLFYFVRRGECFIEQDGRGCSLRGGDFAAQDTSRPSKFEASTEFNMVMLAMPKWFLGNVALAAGRRTAERVATAHSPLLRLAAPLIAGLERTAGAYGLADKEADAAVRMLLPMLGAIYSDSDQQFARGDDLRMQMCRFALDHLHDPNLGPERIAREHFVSVRYVQKLFAAEGGVSSWIRMQRLEGAARELRAGQVSISQIAERWGYVDAASFSRAFRRVYGVSPRELRAAQLWEPLRNPAVASCP